MPVAAHRRHDIADTVWKKRAPQLPGREGSWGGIAHDNRRFIRWGDNGVWERLFEFLIDGPGFEWRMINASH